MAINSIRRKAGDDALLASAVELLLPLLPFPLLLLLGVTVPIFRSIPDMGEVATIAATAAIGNR